MAMYSQVAAHMTAAVAAARQQAAAAMRRPLLPSVVGVLPPMPQPQLRMGMPMSMPPVMGMLPVMPQFNLMRPLQPGQYPPHHQYLYR